jgi:hypothetical protein
MRRSWPMLGRIRCMGMPRTDAGLCDSCRHQRLVPNTRGSVFSLCERSKDEPEYPRYPRLPVVECPGWERRPPSHSSPPS